jgi:hypothetical protein
MNSFGSYNAVTGETHTGYIDVDGNQKFKPFIDIITMDASATLRRWSGLKTFLLKSEIGCGVKVEINEDVGFLRTTTYYRVVGERDRVEFFMQEVEKAIRKYIS